MALPIDQVPTPPTRQDPAYFDARGDALVAALPNLVTQMNEAIDLVNACVVAIDAAIAAGLENAGANASTATTQAAVAVAKASEASDSAAAAAASAVAAAASVASIAGGPVASVNGLTGVVTGVAMQTGSDLVMTRQMFRDCGNVYYDSGATNALDYMNGSVQRWAPSTGAQTLSITNWPPSGIDGTMIIRGVNLGAATITWPSGSVFVKANGQWTSNFSEAGITLQTSGTDLVFIDTVDAGTTLVIKVMR